MKDALLLLLCAIALAHGSSPGLKTSKCNCDPSEAEQICEANFGDNNVLIAHENCDKFYKCTNGKPVAYRCPNDLLYDPYAEQCDWPQNVECGERPISDGSEIDDCDNGTIDEGTDNDNINNGTCNCNPEEAPYICAAEGSDGIFVAHENCNKYYMCSNGRPVAYFCPQSLLYNPYREKCDWPQNVVCGDREILEPDNDTDNDNDNGDNGSEEDEGTCNCNPEEAPAICAEPGSNGVFVAHENCDKYYMCTDGRPVAFPCPANLLYNPFTRQCDWPRNVDCGDRIVPIPEGCEHCNDDNEEDCDDNDNDDNEDLPPAGDDEDDDNDNEFPGADFVDSDEDLPPAGDDEDNDNNNDIPEEDSDGLPPIGDNEDNDNETESPGADFVDSDEDLPPAGDDEDNDNNNDIPEEDSDGLPPIGDNEDNDNETESPGADFVDSDEDLPPAGDDEDNDNNNDIPGEDSDGLPPIGDNEDNDVGAGGNDNGGNDSDNDNGENCNPEEAPYICAVDGSDGVLVAHENCNQFYKCYNGKPVALTCPGNLLYNTHLEVCDWPENVDCGDRLIPDSEEDNNGNGNDNDDNGDDNDNGGGSDNNDNDNDNGGGNDNNENDNDNGGGSDSNDNENDGAGNCNPEEAPVICAVDGSDGVLVAHENCNQFYKCYNGKPVALTCPGNLLYNPHLEVCDWPENVDCGDRLIPDSEEDNNGNGNDNDDNGDDNDNGGGSDNNDNDNDNGAGNDNNDNDNDNGGGSDSNDNENDGAGNCNPEEAPVICAVDGSDGVLVAHENCNQFYKCYNGKPVALTCPGNLLYNPHLEVCDWPENVDCGDRLIPDSEEDNNGNGNDNDDNGDDNDNGGGSDNNDNNNDNGAGNDNNDNDNDNGGGSDSNDNENDVAGNCNPEEAPVICAVDGSDGVLVAHENCNQFYKCYNGKPVALTCPGNLLYNPHLEVCDWPENVDCGDRLIPDSEEDNNGNGNDNDDNGDDNDNGGGSDNNDNDNDNGGGNDNNDNDNDNGGGSDNNDNDNDNGGGNDNNDNDNDNGGGSDSNDNENDVAGNCNPEEAPVICAVDGSDGVLVAHENCNQFYKCYNGKPVTLTCPGNLLYNPHLEVCDWPENVDCGDRLIPDPDEVIPDHEEVIPGPEEEIPDNDGNHDNNDNDNPGTGNCDPSEAPTICAADDSEGVLVAHENCNQFYICNGGKPIVLTCPGILLFNPNTDHCDWPDNVDCGDRVIPDPEEDNNGNGNDNDDNGDDNDNGGGSDNNDNDNDNGGGSDNNDNDNDNGGGSDNNDNENDNGGGNDNNDNDNDNGGGNDNNDNENGGTGNCNPEEAPAICAVDGSDGILVAHENCNQFYKCYSAKPVALTCPENLLYSPHLEVCDWPENVDCGDRLIPDPEEVYPEPEEENPDPEDVIPDPEDDNNGNGNEDVGSEIDPDDNLGNENDSDCPDACNCDPNEAAFICAAYAADGVFVAHEYCNHFYQCSKGRPVVLRCPSNLLYNPIIEQCDWPSNVKCGDRIIPDEDESDNNTDVEDDSENDNNGSCNCNPEEAPAICAVDGSDGVLIAHEICNRFYQCADGKPVSQRCPLNLLYNPHRERCDWPENVDCGDRVISECNDTENDNENNSDNDSDNGNIDVNDDPSLAPTICAESESNGVLVANEYCNQFYICSGGIPAVQTCPEQLLYNPLIAQCDWPRNVDCGDRIVPESDDCPCRPRNAPALCSRADSDGMLIAHENCNQFYMCAEGVPVPHFCPSIQHYSIEKEVCDLPQNVNCGSRMEHVSFNKHLESRQTYKN